MIRVALIATVLVALSAVFVHADGAVDFANHRMFQTPGDRVVRDLAGQPLVGTNYMAQLYYGPPDASASSLNPVTSSVTRFRSSDTPVPGTWIPATGRIFDFSPGQTITLQVRVWDGNFASTYEEAATLGFGETQHGQSALFSYLIHTPPDPAESFYMEDFRGFSLVPEPSVALLATIGIVALYFARRRRE